MNRLSSPPKRVLIVGAGLSGLACAVRLQEAGAQPLIAEASDGVGGRVRTDLVDGFRLDRGFQVFLDAYPEAGRLLDRPQLDLRPFKPGALVFREGRLQRVMDVFREPRHLLASAMAPIGSLADKLRVAALKWRLGRSTLEEIAARPDLPTVDYLQRAGFSGAMIDVFFRAFYGGIFLERDLRTSSRMFEFTFKMFSEGSATLPALGMQEIPRQLANRLPPDAIRLGAPVTQVQPGKLVLADGESLAGDTVVVATDATTTARLLPGLGTRDPAWRAVTGVYFAAPKSPLNEAIIALNGSGSGLLNNVCVLSDVAPAYAPPGQALISLSVLGLPAPEGLEERVRAELESWFGAQVRSWRHLRTDRIERALPEQPPVSGPPAPGFREVGGILVCGDHVSTPSIEGAIVSGLRTAEAVLARLRI
ncbi:MAG: FAD-dependent oxidoreductase [Verrucomicrobia bacterium]|nr:FAD-dependent oxidoreductase [Verrucomicrobiota bacterium]